MRSLRWPWRVIARPGRCGEEDTGYYHGLGRSMPCLRRQGHWLLAHKNQWGEKWK